MSLSGDRVHIAPLGVERKRITEPIIEERADRAILLEYIPPVDYPTEVQNEIEDELESASIEYERKHANLEDLFEAINAFGEAIRNNAKEDDHVFVNISSGNKIGATGGMMACMEYQSATPYYVWAETGTSMSPDRQEIAENITGWDEIPLYPLDRPDEDMLRIMRHIAEADTEMRSRDEPFRVKKDLLKFAEDNEMEFIQGCEGDERAKHNRLRRHVITDLQEKWGFIEIESVGTKDHVMLTEEGENTVRAFAYLLD